MSKKENQKETRTKTWTLVVYPESAPENWRELLDEHHIEWIESPIHDKDLTALGEAKKPHWHILLMFGSLKSYEQVKEISDSLNGPIPERCHNARALVRYMVHMDDPNKVQYCVSDIVSHGGADLSEMLRPNPSERYAIMKELITFVKDNGIREIQDLIDYAMENQYERWFPVLCDHNSYIVVQYIKSQRHRSYD